MYSCKQGKGRRTREVRRTLPLGVERERPGIARGLWGTCQGPSLLLRLCFHGQSSTKCTWQLFGARVIGIRLYASPAWEVPPPPAQSAQSYLRFPGARPPTHSLLVWVSHLHPHECLREGGVSGAQCSRLSPHWAGPSQASQMKHEQIPILITASPHASPAEHCVKSTPGFIHVRGLTFVY